MPIKKLQAGFQPLRTYSDRAEKFGTFNVNLMTMCQNDSDILVIQPRSSPEKRTLQRLMVSI